MAALLVAMSIMAILLSVAMPVWRQIAQREKEEELVFRGQQYARAIGLWGRKYANAAPPNIDVLVDQKFLRRKYKDPITQDDFQALLAGQSGGAPGTPQGGRGAGTPANPAPPQPARGQTGVGATGGVIGVASKSKDRSLRLYNGRSHYNEWVFVYTPQVQAPGGGAPGSAVPGQSGPGRGQDGRGGRGNNPNGPFGGGGRSGGRGRGVGSLGGFPPPGQPPPRGPQR